MILGCTLLSMEDSEEEEGRRIMVSQVFRYQQVTSDGNKNMTSDMENADVIIRLVTGCMVAKILVL